MEYKNENIEIYIKDNWVSYEKMKKLVGGFHYSSAIRFYNSDKKYYLEVKSNDYSSIAFPFYYNSDPTKNYKYVFENKSSTNEHPFYIYDEYLDFLKKLLKIEGISLNKNKIIEFQSILNIL